MPALKPGTILPSGAEDHDITVAATADADAVPLTDAEWALARPLVRIGRPIGTTKTTTKQAVTVRYSPEVLASFRASGKGWQARMNDALKDWLRTHTPA
jgi:uncharacterized protein (DUF4415 family)